MDFQKLRKEYETVGINADDLAPNPFETFRTWLETATENSPPSFETNAMTLATADRNGYVTARLVLLKGIDENSIRFYTNYDSTKGKQLADNPRASIVFHWHYLGRQVRMEGSVEKTSREDSEAYFHSRPRGSQLGAAASKQSATIESREALEKIRADLEKKLEGKGVPVPDNWGGYALTPNRIEFWQGRLDRLHDRVVYENKNGNWETFRVSP